MRIGPAIAIGAGGYARWTPKRLAPALWLAAGRGTTLNGSTVSAAADLAGTGRVASQGTASKQPLYEAAGFNGRPCFTFDGVDDCLQTAAVNMTGTDALTLFVVGRFTSVAADSYVFSTESAAYTNFFGLGAAIPGTTTRSFITDTKGNVGGAMAGHGTQGPADTQARIFTASVNRSRTSNEAALRLNGTSIANGTSFNSNNTGGFLNDLLTIGAARAALLPAPFKMAELVFVLRECTATEMRAFERYAAAKYGISGVP